MDFIFDQRGCLPKIRSRVAVGRNSDPCPSGESLCASMALPKSPSHFLDSVRKFFSASSLFIPKQNSGEDGLAQGVLTTSRILSMRCWGHTSSLELSRPGWTAAERGKRTRCEKAAQVLLVRICASWSKRFLQPSLLLIGRLLLLIQLLLLAGGQICSQAIARGTSFPSLGTAFPLLLGAALSPLCLVSASH